VAWGEMRNAECGMWNTEYEIRDPYCVLSNEHYCVRGCDEARAEYNEEGSHAH